MHLAFSAGLCMLFCGNDGLDGERKAIRHAMIVENLQQLYTDVFSDWIVVNEQPAEELHWRAAATDRYLKLTIARITIQLRGRVLAVVLIAGGHDPDSPTPAGTPGHPSRAGRL